MPASVPIFASFLSERNEKERIGIKHARPLTPTLLFNFLWIIFTMVPPVKLHKLFLCLREGLHSSLGHKVLIVLQAKGALQNSFVKEHPGGIIAKPDRRFFVNNGSMVWETPLWLSRMLIKLITM
jgi:hypothetical protein